MGSRPRWSISTAVWVVIFALLLPLCFGKYDKPMVTDRDLKRRKEACYLDIDNGLWGGSCRSSWIVKENCALRCVSASCYNTIYGDDALEEGEVDFKRSREFRACLRKEMMEERKLEKS